jgi:hypothetical protein
MDSVHKMLTTVCMHGCTVHGYTGDRCSVLERRAGILPGPAAELVIVLTGYGEVVVVDAKDGGQRTDLQRFN